MHLNNNTNYYHYDLRLVMKDMVWVKQAVKRGKSKTSE